MNFFVFLLLIIIGLCFGSFVNALVWRLHENETKKIAKLSIINGRSICPQCRHKLSPADLIPVVSWLFLRGKCRYCKESISWQYPVVELLTLFLFLISYAFWPYSLKSSDGTLFILWLAIIVGFVALTVYDLRWKLLPNRIVYPLIGLAVAQLLIRLLITHQKTAYLESEFFGLIFTAGIFYTLYLLSNGQWIGGGDVKLAIAIGLLVGGPAKAILVVFGASLIGSLVSVPLMLADKVKRNSLIAFGPFLICATYICYLFGSDIVGWYQRLIVP